MRNPSIAIVIVLASQVCIGQVGGGSVYRQDQSASPQSAERAKRMITKEEMPPNATSMFLDASVLINVKADEYVAVFGISQDGATLEECNQKMAGAVAQFSADLRRLGVGPNDLYVDFIAQNRTYDYEVNGDIAREKVAGFELKKNISVHYRDKTFLDKAIDAAARARIFDLVKVDYVVKGIDAAHSRLMEAAANVVKRKAANHARLLGIKLRQPGQVYAEKYAGYFPTDMYSSYTAAEGEDVSGMYYRQKYAIVGARKPRTFYFNALDAKTFDDVINPVVTEPVVQFTLYLKLKYDLAAPKPAEKKSRTPKG